MGKALTPAPDRDPIAPIPMSERLFNALFYALRQRIRWSRPTYRPPGEDKSPFFDAKPHLLPEADRLESAYDLREFRAGGASEEYRESLYVIDLMERLFPVARLRDPVQALDVGSRSFAYARGLYHFYRHAGGGPPRAVCLTGVEADAYQVYSNLHSRYDYARHHIRDLPDCRYLAGDIADHRDRYDVITWFLPFVTEYAHRKWGLPGRLYRPEFLFEHVFSLLKSGGVMVLSNREEEERDIQVGILERLGVAHAPPVRHESDWMAYAPRYVTVVAKT